MPNVDALRNAVEEVTSSKTALLPDFDRLNAVTKKVVTRVAFRLTSAGKNHSLACVAISRPKNLLAINHTSSTLIFSDPKNSKGKNNLNLTLEKLAEVKNAVLLEQLREDNGITVRDVKLLRCEGVRARGNSIILTFRPTRKKAWYALV